MIMLHAGEECERSLSVNVRGLPARSCRMEFEPGGAGDAGADSL
jgi:hypothetical protein